MAGANRGKSGDVVRDFTTRLREEWRREVACQCQPTLLFPCACKGYIVQVDLMEKWIDKNLNKLLEDVEPKMTHRSWKFPIKSENLQGSDKRCVRVFGILLELGHGELIDLFKSAGVLDNNLQFSIPSIMSRLQSGFEDNNIPDAKKIIDKFENAKWAFCPPRLELDMDENFEGNFVMPFCRRERVNLKGGTASVFQAAIKQEFILDPNLKEALRKTLYHDDDHGMCYVLALKSFSEKSKDIYEWEKQAFVGLRDDRSVPIVKYLGCYSHYDGREMSYNLLLEYGQMDLDEYWADLGNNPPVRWEEIRRFWKSLFKVAEAIRGIHDLTFKRGETENHYDGWHADIKPDNILLVHGEFKLADFGFAKFVKRAEKDAKAPQSYIEGGTEAYGTEPAIDRMFAAEDKLTTFFNLGAPEVARARIKKTKTEVKQTIDTWSFGCVLSVAATWIVLGFQGIEQFRVLRMLAAQRYGGTATDRFHDGDSILPDIKHWHNYLAQHARPGDTITPLVLELIESKMLLKDPDYRLSSSNLCEKLEQVIRHAEVDRTSKSRGKQETHDSVKRALLTVERFAPLPGKVSQPKSNPQQKIVELQDVTDGNVSNPNNRRILFNPSIRASNRVGKDKKLNIPFAKTPHREKILEEELENRVLVSAVSGKDEGPSNFHYGAPTDSPTDMNSSPLVGEASDERAKPQPRIPKAQERLPNDDHGWELPASEPEFAGEPATPSRPKPPKIKEPTPPRANTGPSGGDARPQNSAYELSSSTRFSASLESQSGLHRPYSTELPSSPAPSLTVTDITQPPTPTVPETTQKQSVKGKAKVEEEEDEEEEGEVDPGYIPPPVISLPEHLFELPWEICQVRRDIETKIPQGLGARLKGIFKKEPKDEHLEAFIQKRDLVLVIDNGTSMRKFWPIVTFVAITLAMKIAGLDEDGYDVRFTINGAKYDKFGLKGRGGLETLKKTLMAAQPQLLKPTDMSKVLDDLFREHRRGHYRKATTLLALTDGAWEGTIPMGNVDNKIVEFARDLEKVKAPDRHYTIGFIRFGVEFRDRLRALDDELSEKHKIRDIVDQTSWKSGVNKMILGSLCPAEDANDEDEEKLEGCNALGSPTSAFGPEKVIELFTKFNSGQLAPSPSRFGHSRSGSTSSFSLSRPASVMSTPSEVPSTKSRRDSLRRLGSALKS